MKITWGSSASGTKRERDIAFTTMPRPDILELERSRALIGLGAYRARRLYRRRRPASARAPDPRA